jgi:hypothetical protein
MLDGNKHAVQPDCERLTDATGLDLYPFAPFTDEEMKTLDYRVKLKRRQIPDDVLHGMTTRELLYQFVLCDMSPGMYLYNSAQAGFLALAKQLNMLPELLSRPDAGRLLLDLLQGVELTALDDEANCFHVFECMQRIIAQPEVIDRMTKDDIDEYIALMMRHQETIRELSETNDRWSYPESLAAILYGLGNVMLRFEYEPFHRLIETDAGVRGLIAGSNLKSVQTVSLINNCITDFSNRQK